MEGPELTTAVRAALAFGAAALAALGCWLAARAAIMPNAVSARSNHRAPVSRAGGAVVVLVASLGVLAALRFTLAVDQPALNLFVAVACAGLLGLIDDVAELGPLLKLAGLTVIAALAAGAAGPVAALPVPGFGWLGLPGGVGFFLAALWVLGFVNVFNFLDGLNGMAAGTGVALLAGLALTGAAPVLVLCLAGALLGFALPNVLAGRPFLGDAGSLAVGTAVAGAALIPAPGAVWLTAGAAVPLLADAGLTMLRRASEGEPLMRAHSDHAYQRLHRAGWSHQAVALAYTSMVLTGIAVGAALPEAAWAPWAVILGQIVLWLVVTRLMFCAKEGTRAATPA